MPSDSPQGTLPLHPVKSDRSVYSSAHSPSKNATNPSIVFVLPLTWPRPCAMPPRWICVYFRLSLCNIGCERFTPGGTWIDMSTVAGCSPDVLGRGIESDTSPPPPSPCETFADRDWTRRCLTTSLVADSRVWSASEHVDGARTVAAWGLTMSFFAARCPRSAGDTLCALLVLRDDGIWDRAFLLVGFRGGG